VTSFLVHRGNFSLHLFESDKKASEKDMPRGVVLDIKNHRVKKNECNWSKTGSQIIIKQCENSNIIQFTKYLGVMKTLAAGLYSAIMWNRYSIAKCQNAGVLMPN
jgi:hypothetical protein